MRMISFRSLPFAPFAGLILALTFAAVIGAPAGAAEQPGPAEIERAVSVQEMTPHERLGVRAVYAAFDERALWWDKAARASYLKFLVSLEGEGIDANALGPLPDMRAADTANDVRATLTLLRAITWLGKGRITEDNTPGWHLPPPSFDAVAATVTAIRGDDLARFAASLQPDAYAYGVLRAALRDYRRLDAEPWPPLPARREILLDDGSSEAAEVRRRLALLGDLDARRPDAALAAVRRFQARHGLAADGRIGRATISALNVTPPARARQIAANMDVWRALPRQWPARRIVVNTADASLSYITEAKPEHTARVIVGDGAHETPVMSTTVTGITFNPVWNVPASIAIHEILPKLKVNGSYLKENGFIIAGREDDPSGTTIDWSDYGPGAFPFQLRQRPGRGNALGAIKFEMPNPFNIYLHDTPNRALFNAQKRTLSHGCVRVEGIEALAERLIDSPSQWLDSYIGAVLDDGAPRTVILRTPVPVYILYFTAFPGGDGALHFREDIYGRLKEVSFPRK